MSRLIFFLFFLASLPLLAQKSRLIGQLTDAQTGEPLPSASISVYLNNELLIGLVTDMDGRYDLSLPAGPRLKLMASYLGFQRYEKRGLRLKEEEVLRLDIALKTLDDAVPEVIVESFSDKEADALRLTRDDIQNIPTTTMSLESVLLYTAVGVANRNEFSSQYSVRGGNYDENLVYVNGFEIYRPLLIRSGQQEGLSFPNPDMLNELAFSSGGFKAEYGEKMSSVLDVRYRRPSRFEARASGSLLGGSLYFGGRTEGNKALTYTVGARYKTTQYLLSSLDIKGEYVPRFLDLQADLIYDLGKNWQIEAIGNYNTAQFQLIPEESASTSGLYNYAIRLSSLFEGQEISSFNTYMMGTALAYSGELKVKTIPEKKLTIQENSRHRILFSNYQSQEDERIDVINNYRLEEVETGLGADNFGDVLGTLAYGETHQYARNYLTANVIQAKYVGAYSHERFNDSTFTESKQLLKWGLTYKNEFIRDDLKEWTSFDSLGYTLPFDTTAMPIFEYIRTDTQLLTHRFSAFLQNTWEYKNDQHFLRTTLGLRASYWSLNEEFLLAPRFQLYYSPLSQHHAMSDTAHWSKDLTFKLAVGAYHQPPFYRELRNLEGEINTSVRAQKSLHILGGLVWDFSWYKRKFKLISELYYKHQWDLIPYDVDNVRIRYYGDNLAKGYITGWDFRLNGELVKGLESWVNFSLLRARESFDGVAHKVYTLEGQTIDTSTVDYVSKPTDQLFIFSMYFQDELPGAEWFKANLAFTLGSGMHYGVPKDNIVARNLYRYSPYHRIDIGFSLSLWDRAKKAQEAYKDKNLSLAMAEQALKKDSKNPFRYLRSAWLSLEVFNLMAVGNVASNTWVKDFTNTSYAIPNYLSSRRVNLRFRLDF